MSDKTAAFYALGCKVNQNETDAIISLLKKDGYREVPFEGPADVYIINTCTVTHLADRKSRQIIRRAVKNNPEAVVVVTGCYAQTAPGEVLGIPGVNLVVGTKDRKRLPELIEQVKDTCQPYNAVVDIMQAEKFEEIEEDGVLPQRVRAYVKIQEGCNQYCTYCIIPYARGPMRSRPMESVLRSARQLADDGYQEIVLTGIHTGSYGVDFSDGTDLAVLIDNLARIPGLKRLRISSIEPNEVNDKLIRAFTNYPVLCRHLHIPLQSGDDQVLVRMNRAYDRQMYADLIARLKDKIPDIAVTTDIMVGFPGETADEFAHTLEFTQKMEFSGIHVFKYSPRKGTPAAGFSGQVAPDVKEDRSNKLISLGKRLLEEYAENYIGRVVEVLAEQEVSRDHTRYWEGHTDNYLKVHFAAEGDFKGRMVQVLLKERRDDYLIGALREWR